MNYVYLEKVNFPSDLKNFNIHELEILCQEIRDFLIRNVSKTGGHFAPSLGVVELTVALHYVFQMPADKIIWDVGHQAYVHKILTGRKDRFGDLRKYNGLYGYCKPSESDYDIVHAGHSSTSVSVAQGIAEAGRILNIPQNVVAVIGDGAMTAGMAYEALNNVGFKRSKLIIILNDNGMSISENVGAIKELFNKLILSKPYSIIKKDFRDLLSKRRWLNTSNKVIARIIESIKFFILPKSSFFDELGVRYVGPVNGHNIGELVKTLKNIKDFSERPVLLHVITKKGKGYKPAEEDPTKYHSVTPFDPKVGIVTTQTNSKKTYTDVFSEKIVELGEKYPNLVCITPAMKEGSGLVKFAERFPNRFFDVGIAEQHGATFSLGLSIGGVIPVYTIYSTFLQRAYDQVIHDISISGNHVILAIDRGGVVGNDGETHQGIFDISFLKQLPNFVIMAPATGRDLRDMLEMSVNIKSPVAIRYPKDYVNEDSLIPFDMSLEFGKSRVICDSQDYFIISVGHMLKYALEARSILLDKGINVGVIDLTFVKPLDIEMLKKVSRGRLVVTVEDGIRIGGIGETIITELYKLGFKGRAENIGIPDRFPGLGSREEIFRDFGMDANGIARSFIKLVEENNQILTKYNGNS